MILWEVRSDSSEMWECKITSFSVGLTFEWVRSIHRTLYICCTRLRSCNPLWLLQTSVSRRKPLCEVRSPIDRVLLGSSNDHSERCSLPNQAKRKAAVSISTLGPRVVRLIRLGPTIAYRRTQQVVSELKFRAKTNVEDRFVWPKRWAKISEGPREKCAKATSKDSELVKVWLSVSWVA